MTETLHKQWIKLPYPTRLCIYPCGRSNVIAAIHHLHSTEKRKRSAWISSKQTRGYSSRLDLIYTRLHASVIFSTVMLSSYSQWCIYAILFILKSIRAKKNRRKICKHLFHLDLDFYSVFNVEKDDNNQ